MAGSPASAEGGGPVFTVAPPPRSVHTRCACAHWLGGAPGRWLPPDSGSSAGPGTAANHTARCRLVGPTAAEVVAPLRRSGTVFLLGNSVFRGLAFELRSLLTGESIPDRNPQRDVCSASRSVTAAARPPHFDGAYWPTFTCRAGGGGLQVDHGFALWFDNRAKIGTHGFLGNNATKHLASFFWNHTADDVVLVMLGHSYPHEGVPSPRDAARAYLLESIRAHFRGLVVFASATPTVDHKRQGSRSHQWIPQLKEINRASKDFFRRSGVLVIDTWRFCTPEQEHLFADHIHLAERPDGTAGALGFTLLRVFASIVGAARQPGGAWCTMPSPMILPTPAR